jgi:hypothetical protein
MAGNSGAHSSLLKYPDRVLRLNSYGSHLHQYFKRASSPIKEMAECWGLYEYLLTIKEPKDESVLVIIVGDGNSPRLGSLLAVMTLWSVISIDPEMEGLVTEEPIRRLTYIASKLEDVEPIHTNKDLLIVMPHAHVATKLALDKFTSSGERYVVVNPCCRPSIQILVEEPLSITEDRHMMTPHCSLYLYKL